MSQPVPENAPENAPAVLPAHTRVLIVGSGPAGYTAAVYAARAMGARIFVDTVTRLELKTRP